MLFTSRIKLGTDGGFIFNIEALRPDVRGVYDQLVNFLNKEVYPKENEIMGVDRPVDERWTVNPVIEELKVRLLTFKCDLKKRKFSERNGL